MSIDQVILCVDDERIVLNSLTRELKENFGNTYLYEIAENANDALELLEELHDDGMKVILIISDWLMPGMKGDELLILAREKYPDIVTIMLTGQANPEAIERTRTRANLHRYLQKPWASEDLVEAIRSGIPHR